MANPLPPPAPKELETITAILRDMGVQNYDARVPDQLLEFVHAYTGQGGIPADAAVICGSLRVVLRCLTSHMSSLAPTLVEGIAGSPADAVVVVVASLGH
jgi:hypothetical protein